jgi:hypothetical protein
MTRSALPIALAAALLTLAACETADQTAAEETIHWNTPGQPPTSPPPEATQPPPPPPPPPAPPQAARPSGEPQCREYQTSIMIGGKPQKAYGKACRQPDGTWKEEGVHTGAPDANIPVEQSYPYGWHGYDFPSGPRYGPGGMSVGVGAGSRGGWMGYGVGF